MMYRVWQGVILVFVAVLQGTLANYLTGPYGIKPDFFLIMVVYFGISRGPLEGEVIGFLGGLLGDILSGGTLGINALSKTIIGFLSGITKKSVYFENIIPQAAIIAGATLIDASLISLIRLIIYTKPQLNIWIFPLETLYNTLTGILVLQVLVKIRKKIKQEKG